jgi:hypothetical protein
VLPLPFEPLLILLSFLPSRECFPLLADHCRSPPLSACYCGGASFLPVARGSLSNHSRSSHLVGTLSQECFPFLALFHLHHPHTDLLTPSAASPSAHQPTVSRMLPLGLFSLLLRVHSHSPTLKRQACLVLTLTPLALLASSFENASLTSLSG